MTKKGQGDKHLICTCACCGSAFSAYRYEVYERSRKYCSVACQGKASQLPRPGKDELQILYYGSNLSSNQLAIHYGVSKGTIYNWMKLYGIQWRSRSEGQRIGQPGIKHSEAWNAAISRGHKGKRCMHMVGKNNPIFHHSASGRHYAKGGKRDDIGIYVRSSWEANYCRYLNFLVGHDKIEKWEYEPEAFIFHGVERNPLSYTPDFKVTFKGGRIEWHEVKGWMDSNSRSKLKRMAKFYPEVKILVIGPAEYKAIARWSAIIPGWETGQDNEAKGHHGNTQNRKRPGVAPKLP